MGKQLTVFHALANSSPADGELADGSIVHLPDGWTPIGGEYKNGTLYVVCERDDPVTHSLLVNDPIGAKAAALVGEAFKAHGEAGRQRSRGRRRHGR